MTKRAPKAARLVAYGGSVPAVRIWVVDLLRHADLLAAWERRNRMLSPFEIRRSADMTAGAVATEYVAAHVALRRLLARVVGDANARRPFEQGPNGKPRLPGSLVRFSLSRTDGLAAIGIGTAVEIGVDIERVRPVTLSLDQLHGLEPLFPRDIRRLIALPQSDAVAGSPLIRRWTILEAWCKARGVRLSDLLVSGRLAPTAALRGRAGSSDAEEWTASPIALPRGYEGAWCAQGRGLAFEQRNFDPNVDLP